MNARRTRKHIVVSLCSLALVASACGGDDDDASGTTTAGTSAETAAAVTEPPADTDSGGDRCDLRGHRCRVRDDGRGERRRAEAALAELVAAAEEEGSVTIYSSQGLDQLDALAAAFEEAYPGIDVEVVRGTDGDLIPRCRDRAVDEHVRRRPRGVHRSAVPRGSGRGRQLGRPDGEPAAGRLGRLRRRAVHARGQLLRSRGGRADVRLEHRRRARRSHRLSRPARSGARWRPDRRRGPGRLTVHRRLLPVARGVLRRGLHRPNSRRRSLASTRACCRSGRP